MITLDAAVRLDQPIRQSAVQEQSVDRKIDPEGHKNDERRYAKLFPAYLHEGMSLVNRHPSFVTYGATSGTGEKLVWSMRSFWSIYLVYLVTALPGPG
jgi:hypothetical protein